MTHESQLGRLGLFDARVPRYTSYPTAPHFSDQVGPTDVADWLAAIPAGEQVSLYMHVPFCRRLCWFCACRTQGTQSDAPVRAYADTLLAELELLGARLPADLKLSRLHWGGGTPTLMPPDMIRRVVGAVLRRFALAEGGEFSVEIDPNEIDDARMDALAEAGLTRASIGVQDFDPAIQELIGRDQSYEITARAVDMIRARGITSLNADILFGLPNQTPERIAASVEKLIALRPDRVALYGYAHVPWMAKRQVMIPEDRLPSPPQRLALFNVAREIFVSHGYQPIGIDHFALPEDGLAKAARSGALRRNFQGYTDDLAPTLLGLGASSISRYRQGFAQNHPATSAYTRAVQENTLPIAKGHVFSSDDVMRSRMIEALMCDFALDAGEMQQRFGVDRPALDSLLAPIEARFEGYVSRDSAGSLRITREGEPLTRMIAQMLDAYAPQSVARHSAAI